MDKTIIVRQTGDSKYQVFDGDLLLACFGSESAAEDYARRINSRVGVTVPRESATAS